MADGARMVMHMLGVQVMRPRAGGLAGEPSGREAQRDVQVQVHVRLWGLVGAQNEDVERSRRMWSFLLHSHVPYSCAVGALRVVPCGPAHTLGHGECRGGANHMHSTARPARLSQHPWRRPLHSTHKPPVDTVANARRPSPAQSASPPVHPQISRPQVAPALSRRAG